MRWGGTRPDPVSSHTSLAGPRTKLLAKEGCGHLDPPAPGADPPVQHWISLSFKQIVIKEFPMNWIVLLFEEATLTENCTFEY